MGVPHPHTQNVLFLMEIRTGPFLELADSLHQLYLDLENQGQRATDPLQLLLLPASAVNAAP